MSKASLKRVARPSKRRKVEAESSDEDDDEAQDKGYIPREDGVCDAHVGCARRGCRYGETRESALGLGNILCLGRVCLVLAR